MNRRSVSEIETMLKQMGYSKKAIEEIMKWYKNSGLRAEGHSGRSLCSGDTGQQKCKR